ncbi:formyltransferase family protein [Pseudobacteriovorax antillogorgiicola]|uniref:phosphoribosylglycinamide formyltransferase 1 n=1 Tax=Pseudobacteriovorax antillogorgiicola TaxID=1513793 RepID=A0A1Y6CPY1_9BACT|nr:formyltransferase family protein [Pseudobacteriovorax antillogorgiicola]TCS46124.1 phosphoribosylglycinamide formyltransferase/phosphoribosylglycinamide formyltransferase-1 [Pseudobacteriovorax antillogorgiicola]SMF69565.1 phosphoribosylglycinamide formyltransferase/phosphoribosylglycinamide formyltransferase-1 [Pseudobacteriovorax antillogorgiicola]
MSKIPVAVAISGGGRTLKNLLEQQHSRAYEVAAVISSSTLCAGNQIAIDHKLPLLVCDFSAKGQEQAQTQVGDFLNEHHIAWIALAGFLKPFPVLQAFERRIINIHPALLPRYGGKGMYGMNVHRAVLDAGDSISGATIHYVTEKYDEGQIISQATVDVSDAQDAEGIAKQVFAAECRLYPYTLDLLVKGETPDHLVIESQRKTDD